MTYTYSNLRNKISRAFRQFMQMCIVLLMLHSAANAQAIPIDSMYSVVKQFNAHRGKVNWNDADATFYRSLQLAQKRSDTIQALLNVFEMLDDVHSDFIVDGQNYSFYHGVTAEESARMQPLLQLQRSQTGRIFDTVFNNNIAYIRIPTIFSWGDDANALAKAIQDSLCNILNKKTTGCIVDLRLNGGGNMYPMLAGLYPLLGDEDLLQTTNADSSVQFTWLLRHGNLFAQMPSGEHTPVTQILSPCDERYDKMKVMVLIGPVTMSSGQATAVAFYKRKNTLFIGEPSANGYTTVKNYYTFPGGASLNMATGFLGDRAGELYPEVVNPQLWVLGGDNFNDLSKDLKVQMAMFQIGNK